LLFFGTTGFGAGPRETGTTSEASLDVEAEVEVDPPGMRTANVARVGLLTVMLASESYVESDSDRFETPRKLASESDRADKSKSSIST
jgi:hypothetical protein